MVFRATSISDIAGQVTESSASADKVTVGGVLLPSGALKTIRSHIPPDFPKWRDASDEHVKLIVSLLLGESLSICAGSLDKTTEEWSAFWRDAHATHRKASSLDGGSISFLKAATMVRFILFASASASVLGHAICSGQIPRSIARGGRLDVLVSIILDNEIHGQDNRDALVASWKAFNARQPLLNSLGINLIAETLELVPEQSEPLVLLADYVAGLVQCANSQVNTLSRSQVTREAAKVGFDRLVATKKFTNFTDAVCLSYFDTYPDFRHL